MTAAQPPDTFAVYAASLSAIHDVRPPGEADWLHVEGHDDQFDSDGRRIPEMVLRAGGRQFATTRGELWPARYHQEDARDDG